MQLEFQVCDRDLSNAVLSHYLSTEVIAGYGTMGLLPHRDRLCLVQLCDSEWVTVIRIAAEGRPNLKQLMEAADVLKVFHFARFDIATLRYHLGIQVAPIFCTKIASKLARTYTNRLKDLVRARAGGTRQSAQSSDWGTPIYPTRNPLCRQWCSLPAKCGRN